MALPFFYVEEITEGQINLNEENSKYITQVLRKQKGDAVLLTDGKGLKAEAIIIDDHKKKTSVETILKDQLPEKNFHISIAISLLKNTSRFEWFLEKATEIGVSEIIPLICDRTEKEKFRYDRLKTIMISAMLQSQQCWLPQLHQPTKFNQILDFNFEQKFIAHCEEKEKKGLTGDIIKENSSRIILIGPEGDFSPDEIDEALSRDFIPVTLGDTRLRTETAGMVAAVLLSR
jgi:16S rRNA (uracil1498-N3)-methyltransferase